MRILEDTDAGPLIEISFRGKHWNGCGAELINYVFESVQRLKPAGVVMNLDDFKYVFGNDIGALLFPLADEQTGKCRPFCIVACGGTARSLRSLFGMSRASDFRNPRFRKNVGDGLKCLKSDLAGQLPA